ncbi:helix-turn-helix domain-containing protein, partial [Pseudactinotalea sp. Z1739]|uniref:helix-turn-helix domain-containing protein n=1 Tax=Pseudactinotalea sp. Z1739 TaxID=3413028 RepID=UPI003C7A8F6F
RTGANLTHERHPISIPKTIPTRAKAQITAPQHPLLATYCATRVARRRQQGKNTREIMRCLKRAIAREVYRALTREPQPATRAHFKAQRRDKGMTLTQVARALHTRPARISDIENQRRPLPELTARYEQWLQTA